MRLEERVFRRIYLARYELKLLLDSKISLMKKRTIAKDKVLLETVLFDLRQIFPNAEIHQYDIDKGEE
jgi:hypothetical protein